MKVGFRPARRYDRGVSALRKYLFELLALSLIGGSMVFFYQCVRFLSRRDYIASAMLLLIGVFVIRAGIDLARLALLDHR